jgi:hypothetical protein
LVWIGVILYSDGPKVVYSSKLHVYGLVWLGVILYSDEPKVVYSSKLHVYGLVWLGVMVFNTTLNNISVISWRSVLLVEETGVPGENHRTVCKSLRYFFT